MKLFKGVKGKLTLCALFLAAAGYVEWNGYEPFDREDATNALCDIDPTCRYMTEDEIAFAEDEFNGQGDFDNIKIFNRPYFLVVGLSRKAIAPNGHIYAVSGKIKSNNFVDEDVHTQSHYIHELAHAIQHQQGIRVRWEGLRLFLKYGLNYSTAYKYEGMGEDQAPNIEQQAKAKQKSFLRVHFIEESETAIARNKSSLPSDMTQRLNNARCDSLRVDHAVYSASMRPQRQVQTTCGL